MSDTATTTTQPDSGSLHPAEQLALLSQVPASTATVGDCQTSLRTITRLRSYLDVVESEFARRLRQLHTAGQAEAASSIIAETSHTSARDAQKKERRSEILDSAEAFSDGLKDGRITGEHVDVLAAACANVDDEIRSKILDEQEHLVNDAAAKTPAQLARELRDLVRLHEHDAGVARDTQQRRDTYLNLKLDASSGMYRLNGLLHPELGTSINSAINNQVRHLIGADQQLRNEPRSRLNAEALGQLVGLVASGQATPATRPTAQINVLIDYQTLTTQLHAAGICETTDGAALPAWKVRQLACDNDILPIVMGGDSVALDVGRARRHFTRHQRAALRAMYATCAMPGCDTPFDRCEIHHLDPWEHGGTTDLANAVPLCSHCHHVIHQPGWSTHIDDDRTLTITTPTGRTLVSTPGLVSQVAQSQPNRPTAPTLPDRPPETHHHRAPSGHKRPHPPPRSTPTERVRPQAECLALE